MLQFHRQAGSVVGLPQRLHQRVTQYADSNERQPGGSLAWRSAEWGPAATAPAARKP